MDYQDWLYRLEEGAKFLYSNYPPEKETIQIIGPKPVSFRAKREDKELIEKAIKIQAAVIPWLCTEDISIRIEWMINDRERYESDRTPDADNIIKPILDSLCGPDGLIIDDCQVVSLYVNCLGGWVHGKNNFELHIELPSTGYYKNNACIPKKDIQMVHIGKNLYFPINKELPSEIKQISNYVEWIEKMPEDHSDEGPMPMRRFFHKSRVYGQFDTIEAEEFINNFI